MNQLEVWLKIKIPLKTLTSWAFCPTPHGFGHHSASCPRRWLNSRANDDRRCSYHKETETECLWTIHVVVYEPFPLWFMNHSRCLASWPSLTNYYLDQLTNIDKKHSLIAMTHHQLTMNSSTMNPSPQIIDHESTTIKPFLWTKMN